MTAVNDTIAMPNSMARWLRLEAQHWPHLGPKLVEAAQEIERLQRMANRTSTVAPPTCVITGRIAGDSDACGDCDPCGAAHAVPDVIKQLLAEKDEWRNKYAEAMERSSPDSDPVSAERERCAKLAEQYDNYTVDGRPSAVGAVIAAAIRGS